MIGVDLIKIARFRKIKAGDYAFWRNTFSKSEWQIAFGQKLPWQKLSGIFAAKEAVYKALRGKVKMSEITVDYDDNGAPNIRLTNKSFGAKVSVSHDGGYTIAVALAYDRKKKPKNKDK